MIIQAIKPNEALDIKEKDLFEVLDDKWNDYSAHIAIYTKHSGSSKVECNKCYFMKIPSVLIRVIEDHDFLKLSKGDIFEVPLDEWKNSNIAIQFKKPESPPNSWTQALKSRFVEQAPEGTFDKERIWLKLRAEQSNQDLRYLITPLYPGQIVHASRKIWDDPRITTITTERGDIKYPLLSKARFEEVPDLNIHQQITSTSGQINQPKGNEMVKSVDLAFLKSIANVDEKDEFFSVLTAGPAKAALEAAKAKRKEQQEARLGEEMLNILEQLDVQKKSRIEAIRQHRANISRMKTELDQMDRAMAYANETNNFLPLCKLMSLVRGDTPEFEVPKDWTPKEIGKAE